jgi:hypothetical protein
VAKKLSNAQAAGVAALLGLVFALGGGRFVAQGVGLLPLRGDLYAPRWVLAVCGLVFMLPGLALLLGALKMAAFPALQLVDAKLAAGFFVAIILSLMAIVFGGVVWYGDPEGYEGGITGTVTEGRIVFGIATVVLAFVAFVFWVLSISAATGRRARKRPGSDA